ncbi:hypothetical protein H4582DRAFT_779802 [Lactarius indigo]|nr:hypothetical protein H4582DRAFT_779802 [Lactarius indigo]
MTTRRSRCILSDRFATFMSLCTKVPVLPQRDSPPPRAIGRPSRDSRPRIRCATSLAIFTAILPPRPFLALLRFSPLHFVRPPQHDIFVPESLNPPHQMAAEDLHIPPASHDPVTASVRVLQGDVDTSTTITPLPTPEPSVNALPPGSKTLASLPGVIAVQHVEDRGTSPDVLGVPSLPSLTPVLGNVFLTGSHTPLLAPAIPSTSLRRLHRTWRGMLLIPLQRFEKILLLPEIFHHSRRHRLQLLTWLP